MNMERPSDIGILAIEIYFPNSFVSQKDLEKYDGEKKGQSIEGKYTVGLGQTNMAFVNDREDICSMSLTVVKMLMEKHNIGYDQIGKLETGTESSVDKSKSLKSFIMQLFQEKGNTDIEGIDNINACYGGTAALFNAVHWIESSHWDGRLALVVAGDVAVYESGPARPTGGAGVVAMLIGPNASIVIEPGLKGTHMEHAYDFYKPNMKSEYPIVDGQFSIICYLRALDNCYKRYKTKYLKKHHHAFDLSSADYFAFHCPFSKLVQKSFARLVYNDYLEHSENYPQIPAKFKDVKDEESYTNMELEKAFIAASQEDYKSKVLPSLFLAKELGNIYTGSLYSCLLSLLCEFSDTLVGKRILMFSYGSGLAASMFSIKITKPIDQIISKVDIKNRIASRVSVSAQEFNDILYAKEQTYGHAHKPTGTVERIRNGTYFLNDIDEKHRRHYLVKQ